MNEDLKLEAMETWANYAKDRFVANETKRANLQSTARQLGFAFSFLVGFAITLIGYLFSLKQLFAPNAHAFAATVLLLCLLPLVLAWGRIFWLGFVSDPTTKLVSPKGIRDSLQGKCRDDVIESIGRGYSESETIWERDNANLCKAIRVPSIVLTIYIALIFAVGSMLIFNLR